jgi:hypothetical protein
MYLERNKFYQFPKYIKQNFEENQIMPNVVSSFINKSFTWTSNDLLSKIDSGKELYFKDVLLPEYSDADKMGYTKSS